MRFPPGTCPCPAQALFLGRYPSEKCRYHRHNLHVTIFKPGTRTIQNNSDLAQGPHPIRPSKVRRSDIYLAPGGVHGTETKTSYRRDGSCDGVDHPSGHDVGGGSAELVTDLPP